MLFTLSLMLTFLGACAAPPKHKGPVQAASLLDPGQIAKDVVDLIDPRQQPYRDFAAAMRALQQKIEQVDIATFNSVLEEVHESVEAIRAKTDAIRTESIGLLADEWREPAGKLSATIETLQQKISAIETEQFNQAIQNISELAQSWHASGRELQALLADVRQLLDEIDSKEITGTIEQLHQSSQHIEKAAAKLPSTSASLSTTIWLLNALLAIGITLGVIRIVRSRSSNRRS